MSYKNWKLQNGKEEGSLQVLLVLFLMGTVLMGFGVWGYLRNWRFLMQKQLRLDRCVGQIAQDLRDRLNSVASANSKIEHLRDAIKVGSMEPGVLPTLKAALHLVVVRQQWLLVEWQMKQVKWLGTHGCGHLGDLAFPLPGLKYIRDSPDAIGPNILRWPEKEPTSFHLQLQNRPRAAAAQVSRGVHGTNSLSRSWQAVWAPPLKTMRPDFY